MRGVEREEGCLVAIMIVVMVMTAMRGGGGRRKKRTKNKDDEDSEDNAGVGDGECAAVGDYRGGGNNCPEMVWSCEAPR